MQFSECTPPVKYLDVPLISTRLLYKDCKILVEKVQNRIGDFAFCGEVATLHYVANLTSNGAWKLPYSWLLKAPNLLNVPPLVLVESRLDQLVWHDRNDVFSKFSLKHAMEAIRPRGDEMTWHHVVLFSHSLPCFSPLASDSKMYIKTGFLHGSSFLCEFFLLLRRIRALEQETRDLDVEIKQMKDLKASYGVNTPQELRRNQD
ncbi:hypothetical protein Tco_1155502 [Tanacetum coccineum]